MIDGIDILGASSIFDWVFGGTDTFMGLPAVVGMRSILLGLSYLLFILGLSKLLSSRPSEFGGKFFIFVIALLALSLWPKFAITVYDLAGIVQQKAGVNPENIGQSLDRIIELQRAEISEPQERSFFAVADRASDALLAVVIQIILGLANAFAIIIAILIQFAYFLRDIAFIAALLAAPLAIGFTVSPVGRERGIQLLFGSLGIALWPLGWLFIDALVQLVLAPLDSTLSLPLGANNGLGRALPALGGVLILVVIVVLNFKLLLVVAIGYTNAAIFIQRVFSGISGQVFRWGTQATGGNSSAGGSRSNRAIQSLGRVTNLGGATTRSNTSPPRTGSPQGNRFGGREGRTASLPSRTASRQRPAQI